MLYQHPGVAEPTVTSVAHSKRGDKIVADVVRCGELTDAELLTFCRERLAESKCPEWMRFREALAKTATGRIGIGQDPPVRLLGSHFDM